MKGKVIKVESLTRVEGEGAIAIKIRDGAVQSVQLRIYEPPRFFEAFLRGRSFSEVPDLVARICGICPVAHQVTSAQAIENAFGVEIQEPVRILRRLLVCGEWIESHALHVLLLHAPDFLGYPDAIRMAQDHPDVVRRGLELKKLGNDIMALLGGREIHPVNVKIGGFYRLPVLCELEGLAKRLEGALETALNVVRWVSDFSCPDFENDYEVVALRHPSQYPMNEGVLASSSGSSAPAAAFEEQFAEEQVAHSNALHSRYADGRFYLVGPLARYNLNFDRFTPLAQEAARSAGLSPSCGNPFQSIIIRSVELVYACEEAMRLIAAYEPPARIDADVLPRPATGCSLTEAPRGLLYHRYRVDGNGLIVEARIVPPTAQNQAVMEDDLRRLVSKWIDMPKEELTRLCEQAIRNYDPCISCATHLLRVGPVCNS